MTPKEDLNILENQGESLNFFDLPILSTSTALSKVDDIFSELKESSNMIYLYVSMGFKLGKILIYIKIMT